MGIAGAAVFFGVMTVVLMVGMKTLFELTLYIPAVIKSIKVWIPPHDQTVQIGPPRRARFRRNRCHRCATAVTMTHTYHHPTAGYREPGEGRRYRPS